MGNNKFSDEHRVNATAMFCYAILMVILIAAYLLEVIKKSRTIPYFIVFVILAVLPYVVCKIMLHKNKESEQVKYALAGCYMVFYLFILFTTISPIAYICYYGGNHFNLLQPE